VQPTLDCNPQLRIGPRVRRLHLFVEVVPQVAISGGICETSFQGLCRMNVEGRKYVLVAATCVTTIAADDRKLGYGM